MSSTFQDYQASLNREQARDYLIELFHKQPEDRILWAMKTTKKGLRILTVYEVGISEISILVAKAFGLPYNVKSGVVVENTECPLDYLALKIGELQEAYRAIPFSWVS